MICVFGAVFFSFANSKRYTIFAMRSFKNAVDAGK